MPILHTHTALAIRGAVINALVTTRVWRKATVRLSPVRHNLHKPYEHFMIHLPHAIESFQFSMSLKGTAGQTCNPLKIHLKHTSS